MKRKAQIGADREPLPQPASREAVWTRPHFPSQLEATDKSVGAQKPPSLSLHVKYFYLCYNNMTQRHMPWIRPSAEAADSLWSRELTTDFRKLSRGHVSQLMGSREDPNGVGFLAPGVGEHFLRPLLL